MKHLVYAFGCTAWLLVAGDVVAGSVGGTAPATDLVEAQDRGRTAAMPLPLKVLGTHVVNSRGERVRLRGVNAAGMEWSSDGEGHILDTVTVAIRDWHVNHIRLPLAQDRWFGKAPEQKDGGAAYRALVEQVVDLCASRGCYVILDLHWSDLGEWGRNIGQHPLPDRHSLDFWKEVARDYKNHPAVLFDLYNEPFRVSWDAWRDGGRVSEQGTGGRRREFDAVGMQAMLDVVRSTGAKNVVIVGGLDWSYDMSGFLKGYRLDDRGGYGIIYANHAYPFKGDSVARWVAKMEEATRTLPVIVSEFGGRDAKDEPWVRQVLEALEDHRWNWTAWDMHPAASPCLIRDWTYTPTPFFGQWVKRALEDRLPRYPAPPAAATRKGASVLDRAAHAGIAHAPPGPRIERSRERQRSVTTTAATIPLPDGRGSVNSGRTRDNSFVQTSGADIGPLLAVLRAGLLPAIVPVGPAVGDQQPEGLFASHRDVGDVRHPGSIAFDKGAKTYTVTGSGANMWARRDAFHFAWERIEGDVSLAADIAFVGRGKEPHRKACLIIREDLDADSAYVDAALHGDGLTSLQFRDVKDDLTHEVQANVWAPKRLRIEKKGKYVRLYVDSGGGMQFSGAAVRIALREPFYVGLGVCSHDADVTETAVFSNVELSTKPTAKTGPATLYSTLETLAFPSTDRRVVFVTPKRIEAPNWLRDGQHLLYNSEGRIHRIPVSGGQPEVIDTGFANRCNNDHGVSPDGKLLAISDQSQGRHHSLIYTLPVTGGQPTLVTPNGPSYWHGWSPDGRTLAYCADRGGKFDVYTIPVEGGTEMRLTTAKGLDDGPEYSPDGRWIYFNSMRTGTMQLWRMRPDGSEQEALTADEWNNWFPHPSPDGRSLVFLSFEKGIIGHPPNKDVTLRRMTLADRKIEVVGRFFGGQGTVNVPCWSPDGRKIAFVTYQIIP